ncbi:MAG TPA: hypothetical protein VLK03_11675 [Nocardioides sp.]|nr:hypothetical protein [Nocardioides sp.]
MPVTSTAPDRVPPPPLVVAASLTALQALALAGLGALELVNVRAIRLTMGLTTSAFFIAAAVALAWCAWSLWRVRRWARGPVVMAELIQLGLAWNLRGGETTLVAVALAVVALVVIAGLLHPATTAVLEDEPDD